MKPLGSKVTFKGPSTTTPKTPIGEVAALLTSSHAKRYFKRFPTSNAKYLSTADEQRQRKQIEALFNKFDSDCSGNLNKSELLQLYN